ncbi:hypothetical protein ADL02_07015 [Streptomyces sp. NRRL WC-3723]|nr:hypothetical protein ADL02_07015 [Streptomyces sp. NRRL WC-3723]
MRSPCPDVHPHPTHRPTPASARSAEHPPPEGSSRPSSPRRPSSWRRTPARPARPTRPRHPRHQRRPNRRTADAHGRPRQHAGTPRRPGNARPQSGPRRACGPPTSGHRRSERRREWLPGRWPRVCRRARPSRPHRPSRGAAGAGSQACVPYRPAPLPARAFVSGMT